MLPKTLIGWNLPFDAQWLPKWVYDCEWIDGMTLHGVLHPDAPARSLKLIGPRYTGLPYEKTLADGPMTPEELEKYLATDVFQTGVAVNCMLKELDKHPSKVFFSWLMGLERDLSWMSQNGAKIDLAKARELATFCLEEQRKEVVIMQQIGESFGIQLKFAEHERFSFSRSNKQLYDLIYNKLALPKHYTQKGNLSLDAETTLALLPKDRSGFLSSFSRFMDHQENVSRYIYPYVSNHKDWVDAESFVHPMPNLVRYDAGADSSEAGSGGTVTGRVTWKEPAVQVIPEFARPIYVPRCPGGKFWVSDLSQAEPRAVAFMSGEDVLIEAFATGRDIYRMLMSVMLNVQPETISKEVRDAGKTIYLASLYGAEAAKIQTVFRMEAHINIPLKDCQEMLKRRRKELPKLTAWTEQIIDDVSNGRPLITPTGRSRLFPRTDDPEVLRQAINYKPQSFASDLNHAICREIVADAKTAGDFWPLFTVHDSIEVDTAPEVDFEPYLLDVYGSVPHIVKQQFGIDLNVPIAYTVQSGDYWR